MAKKDNDTGHFRFVLICFVYRIAKRRGVFKVETVGDCYVAVCGLPDPRKDHAVVMTRFARECLARMHELSRRLDVVLGPGTGELGMRIGLHSGPGEYKKAFFPFRELLLDSKKDVAIYISDSGIV